jgi:hypothetical protein
MYKFWQKNGLGFMYLGEIFHQLIWSPWSKSYDRELQRQRCKNLQRHEKPSAFKRQKIFSSALKNTLARYSAGVVFVGTHIHESYVGLAPGVNPANFSYNTSAFLE